MYIEIKQDKQCGQCLALNQHEIVWRGNEQIIRCRKCGHEKLIAITCTVSMTGEQGCYNANTLPSKEIF